MENSIKNIDKNISSDRFIYTDSDISGITIFKKEVVQFMELLSKLHKLNDPAVIFDDIVSHLMNQLCINASGKKFRIIECELYYDDKNRHQDPFLYGHDKQSKLLKWCFHYSGIDLTIGNGSDIRGGILIRSILDIENGLMISGPLKSSNCILNTAHFEAFPTAPDHTFLRLEPQENNGKHELIEKSIRIGLDKGKILNELTTTENGVFHNRDYRYVLQSYSLNKKCVDDSLKNKKRMDVILKESKQ